MGNGRGRSTKPSATQEPTTVRVGEAGARSILEILKRHGQVRFDNSHTKDLFLAELATLEVSGDDSPEPPHAKAPAAHPGARQVEGDHGGFGQDPAPGPGENPPTDPPPAAEGDAPGYDHDGD